MPKRFERTTCAVKALYNSFLSLFPIRCKGDAAYYTFDDCWDKICQSCLWLISDLLKCTCHYCVDGLICHFKYSKIVLARTSLKVYIVLWSVYLVHAYQFLLKSVHIWQTRAKEKVVRFDATHSIRIKHNLEQFKIICEFKCFCKVILISYVYCVIRCDLLNNRQRSWASDWLTVLLYWCADCHCSNQMMMVVAVMMMMIMKWQIYCFVEKRLRIFIRARKRVWSLEFLRAWFIWF